MKLISKAFPIFLLLLFSAPYANSQVTAEEFYNQALEVKKKGKYDAVIGLLDKAIRLNSNYIAALLERSRAKQNNQRDLDGAMLDLETILQLDPSNGEAYFERARLRNSLMIRMLEKKGPTPTKELMPYFQEVLDDVNAAISNGFRNKESLRYRADLNMRSFRKFKEAIDDFTEALIIDPQDTGLYNNRAAAKYQSGDLEGASDDQREIIRLYEEAKAANEDPENPKLAGLKRSAVRALISIGSNYGMMERPDLQLWAIEKSIELEPNADAYAARGRYHMIFGELNDAIADYTKAIELAGAGSLANRFLLDRGIVYTLNGELDKAEADFSEGKKDPQMKYYTLKYWLELARRQREQRKIRVEIPSWNRK